MQMMKFRTLAIILLFLFIALFMTKCTSVHSYKTDTEIQCDESLLNRVYKLYRLQVIEKCKQVTGPVAAVRFEEDGDYHILLKLDSGQENLLNTFNYERQNGCLVVETVCAFLVNGKNPKAECDNYVNKVYLPSVGERVEVIGTYVVDTKHSWTEIHPATSITLLKN